ncbi:hypothetical protein MNB_SM-5-164 [hydrothermal vent metagenome]|uniref:Uncharacterized protein n=1 Tax=hydrothermal vent metagenome TaxID=652676 RepID=A0A1W1BXZ1_9ZZZZ
MELNTSTWMMIAFVVGMIVSIWKLYPFLVNKKLEDDDRGEDTYNLLVEIMYDTLKEFKESPTLNELHDAMKAHKKFDTKKLWRFNPNKLNQLLNRHYLENEHLNSIKDIHQKAGVKEQ